MQERNEKMTVTFIGHSGFFADAGNVCMLFDYYKGEIPRVKEDQTLVVFVSHRHHDHYSREIWNLRKKYRNIFYILSQDISMSSRMRDRFEITEDEMEHMIVRTEPDRKYHLDLPGGEMKIETLKSTDEGVAFFVEYGGKTLYHAGDLNLWIWPEEGEEWNREMEQSFFAEIEKLKGRYADVAFIPLDPRLGADAFGGMDACMDAMNIRYVFPMHCWKEYDIIKKYREARADRPWISAVMQIEQDGQEFVLE